MKLFLPAFIRFPLEHGNGLQTVRTAEAFARAGADVTLIVRQSDPRPTEEILRDFFGIQDPDPKLRVVRLQDPLWRPGRWHPVWYGAVLQGIFFLRSVVRILTTRGEKVILTRSLREAAMWLRLRGILRAKVAYEAHAVAWREREERSRNLGENLAASPTELEKLRNLEGSVLGRVDQIFAITAGLRDDLAADFGLDPARITVVPDAFDRPEELPAKTPGAGQNLLVISALFPWKGIDALIEALPEVAAKSPNFGKLIVIGGQPSLSHDADRERLEALARKLNVDDRVEFRGFIPASEAFQAAAEAEIAVLSNAKTSIGERWTSPLKLFGYFAYGLAVVAPDFSSMREIIRDGENGLLYDPKKPGALAARIVQLLEDADLRQRLAAQARKDAKKFTWEERGRQIIAALGGR